MIGTPRRWPAPPNRTETIMKFMLLLHAEEKLLQADPGDARMSPEFAAFNDAMVKAGALVAGARLRPTSAATTVRVAGDRTEVLDGPYADTREQLGGFYIIEAADLEAATDWAARCPSAAYGTVEIRPLWQAPAA
jgi:hypothetical protein